MEIPSRVIAILIGVERPATIEYPDSGSQFRFRPLRGVANDLDWYAEFFYKTVQAPVLLTLIRPPEPSDTTAEALKNTVREAFADLRDGDLLVLVLCGHGFQVRDQDGDETEDRFDEAFATSRGLILDDFFNEVWTTPTNARAAAIAIVDTCNSDTLGIKGFQTRPITVHHDAGLPRISVSASEQWQKARETKSQTKPRGYFSQALEDAWTHVPEARTSYRALFETAAELVGGRSNQASRIRYYGPADREDLLDAAPFGYRSDQRVPDGG